MFDIDKARKLADKRFTNHSDVPKLQILLAEAIREIELLRGANTCEKK